MRFVVPGIPVAWQRTRTKDGRHFTAKETRAFKARVVLFAKQAKVPYIESGPVVLRVEFWFPMKGQPRKRVPRPQEWKDTRPDLDNCLKAILDAGNGCFFADDGQVAHITVSKRRCPQGCAEGPRTVVWVEPLSG